MNQLGVAVVGTGFGSAVHIPGFKHHPRTEVVALYHRHPEKARQIALEHGITYYFSDLEELLSLESVEAVSLSTPPFLHYPMAKQIILAKKHLLLEKPMTMTFQECQELYYLAKQQGVIVAADFEFRTIPAWQLLAQYLAQDYVGKIRLIKVDWLVASRANPTRPWNWYSCQDKGGGVLGAIGSHVFDYLHWLFGPATRLIAQMYCSIRERPDPIEGGQLKEVDADDTTLILLELTGNIPVQVNLSSVTYQGRGHWLEVYGEKGTLILGSDNLKDYVHGFKLLAAQAGSNLIELEIPKALEFKTVFTDGRIAPFLRIVDRWVEAIETGISLVPSLKEGVYSQLLMHLAQQSSQSQKWLEIPSIWL